MSIETPQSISDVFAIFHDGGIVDQRVEGTDLVLTVEIEYLAQRVSPDYKSFQIRLAGARDMRFTTWPNERDAQPRQLASVDAIFAAELDILSSTVEDGAIRVVCNQPSTAYDYCGGELVFHAERATVTDEAGTSYAIDALDKLCKGYWDHWREKQTAPRES